MERHSDQLFCVYTNQERNIQYLTVMMTSGLSFVGSLATVLCFLYFQEEEPFVDESPKKNKNQKSEQPSEQSSYSDLSYLSRSFTNNQPSSPLITRLRKESRKPTLVKLMWSLGLADMFLSAIMFTGHLVLYHFPQDRTFDLCRWLRVIEHFFALSSFVWTCNIAFTVFRMLVRNQGLLYRKSARYGTDIINNLLGWGFPLVISIVLLANNGSMMENSFGWCHPTGLYEWLLWFTPLLTSVMWNLVFFSLFMYHTRAVFGTFASEYNILMTIQRRLSIYLIIFVICWVWDVIIHFMNYFAICPPFTIHLLQSLFSPLQGFINFIVYTRSYMLKFHNPCSPNKEPDPKPSTPEVYNEASLLLHIQNNINSYYNTTQ